MRANGRKSRGSAAALVLAVALLIPSLAAGASPTEQDPRQQRDEVRKEKAAAARDVDALRASDTEVKQALADIQANLSGQMAALDDARFAETQANEAARQARVKEQAVQSQIAAIKDQLREVAVRAYVDGGVAPQVFDSSGSTQMDDLLRQTLLGFQATRSVGLADQLRAAEEDLAIARKEAETNAAIAAQKRAEIEQRVGEVQAAQRQQAAYVADVEARLDQRLSEAANLSVLDKQLSDQITAQEAALAARLPSGGPTGGSSAPIADFPLSTVRGITVASSIAGQLEQMLNAAEADGVSFGGSGYRDSNQQWELRKRNCPDPANSPPSACRPPTARAGASMHERGLAIDFTYAGRIVSSGDPGYRWLSANAGRFGFSNRPGEPWHWSVNGQ